MQAYVVETSQVNCCCDSFIIGVFTNKEAAEEVVAGSGGRFSMLPVTFNERRDAELEEYKRAKYD